MKQMMGDVTKAITVAKAKLGVNGWIRTTASSEFKNLLLNLLKPVQKNWVNLRAGTSIQCWRAPLEPDTQSDDAHAEALKARKPYVDEAWNSVRAAVKTQLNKLVLDILGPEWVVVYEGDYGPHFLQALVRVLLLLLLVLVLPLLLLY